MAGVIGHIANPTPGQCADLARHAEEAGADWIGFADAFWWRDVWMALTHVAAATSTIHIGPAMTNAYLRHPFHTVSALATLQEQAPSRVFVGVTAGGSEVSAAAGISRRDAPERIRTLVDTIRQVEQGGPLDEASGRGLDVTLGPVSVLMAARGDRMLRAAGELADRVLLWAIPDSDLDRTVDVIMSAATDRDRPPELVWAPLVEHDASLHASIMHVAVYASLNTRASVRSAWGLDADLVERIRAELVRGGTEAAAAMVPSRALDDLLVADASPDDVSTRARTLGVTSIAVPGFSVDTVEAHVNWARAIEAQL